MKLVAACNMHGIIGVDGEIPWRVPEDLKRFKQITTGHSCIMGRNTYDSIIKYTGGKPLPDRENIVVSRKLEKVFDGFILARSLSDAYDSASLPVCVIGGGELYEQALPHAIEIDLTLIPDGASCVDWKSVGAKEVTLFPWLSPLHWTITEHKEVQGNFKMNKWDKMEKGSRPITLQILTLRRRVL